MLAEKVAHVQHAILSAYHDTVSWCLSSTLNMLYSALIIFVVIWTLALAMRRIFRGTLFKRPRTPDLEKPKGNDIASGPKAPERPPGGTRAFPLRQIDSPRPSNSLHSLVPL